MGNHEFKCEVCGRGKSGLVGCDESYHTTEDLKAARKERIKQGLSVSNIDKVLKLQKNMRYFALGDSITSDDYPDKDAGSKYNGAGSQFGQYLRAARHIISYKVLAEDGATIKDVWNNQVPKVLRYKNEELLITLTVGGNDISFKLMDGKPKGLVIHETFEDWLTLINKFKNAFKHSKIIVNTLYDPTDDTGVLPENCGEWARIAMNYSICRRELGNSIRVWARQQPENIQYCDIFQVFRDHGASVDYKDDYYYKPFVIEPSFGGATSIANAWIDIFEGAFNKTTGE